MNEEFCQEMLINIEEAKLQSEEELSYTASGLQTTGEEYNLEKVLLFRIYFSVLWMAT